MIKQWYRNRLESPPGEPVRKALSNESFKRLQENHSVGGEQVVDHTIHTKIGAPKPLQNLLNSPERVNDALSGGTLGVSGSSAKVIHDVSTWRDPSNPGLASSGLVMSKPYHQKVNSGYNLPIYGWSTMATKGLFNAAGMGDKAEDVSASVQNGIPLTHHVFAPDRYKTFGEMRQLDQSFYPKISDVHKMAVMDYLTNNIDRHSDNVMVDPHTNNLLAIDHERNFQYKVPVGRHRHAADSNFDLPHDYLNYSALGTAHGLATQAAMPEEKDAARAEVAGWWRRHKDAIRNEMVHQVAAIKDPDIKSHVLDNFGARWKAISDWAGDTSPENYKTHDLFDQNFSRPVDVKSLSGRYVGADKVLEQYKNKTPDQIVSGIGRVLRDKPEYAVPMSDTLRAITRDMPADKVAEHFLNNYDNKNWNSAADLIWHQPKDKMVDILRAVQARLDKYPDHGESQLPFLKQILDRADRGLEPLSFDKTKEAV